jgi:hypothetical protein
MPDYKLLGATPATLFNSVGGFLVIEVTDALYTLSFMFITPSSLEARYLPPPLQKR